ncbi:MAG: beta-N-acetylhexosaminidase [Spirochaetales bacterium]|nr:beta-N-acetylhexosaminidase [Spirochaetales bacterium]
MRSFLIGLLLAAVLISCSTTPVPSTAEAEKHKKTVATSREKPEISIVKESPSILKGKIPIKQEPSPVSEDTVTRILEKLTLKQKIGQKFISWIPGTDINKKTTELLKKGFIGGVILNSQNIKNREQVKRLTIELQKTALTNNPSIELLIGADQEGGRVARFRFNQFTKFPAAYYWGVHNDPYFIEAAAYITGKEMSGLGCNINFAPVLDLYGKPNSSVIGDRSMGNNAGRVSDYGLFYLKGAKEAGIIPVIKHFPGHGITQVDSHLHLPVVDISEEELFSKDILPFKAAIENGADALMTAHILYKKIDPEYPVTCSKKIITGILREKLEFKGVIISDAIDMGALTENYTMDEIIKTSINAGVDIILVNSRYDTLKLEEKALNMFKKKEIKLSTINESVKRIIRLKLKYALIPFVY